MKNIVGITLSVLAILLAGFLLTNYLKAKNNDLTFYLPRSFSTARPLTLYTQNVTAEEKTVTLGSPEEVSFNVLSTQGQYIDDKNKLALSVWIEEVSEGDFQKYKEKAWERYQAPEREGLSEQHTYDNHEIYLSFRNLQPTDDTRTMVTMGGGYVFFPERNVVVTYTFFNPQLYGCEDVQKPDTCMYDPERQLPTMDDSKAVAEQIVSSFEGAN